MRAFGSIHKMRRTKLSDTPGIEKWLYLDALELLETLQVLCAL
jgi:hypothetical protein